LSDLFVYENRRPGSTRGEPLERFEIEGTLIGHGDNRDEERTHWVDVDVFRLSESGKLATHRAGMSLVYHRYGNDTCKLANGRPKGLQALPEDLPEGAVSCDVCKPPWPEDLTGGDEIWFEFPRHSVKVLATAEETVRDLFEIRGKSAVAGASRAIQFGSPALRALAQCRENDPEFATIEDVIRIS